MWKWFLNLIQRPRPRYFQKQPLEVFCNKRCSWKCWKFYRKTPVLEPLFDKVSGLQLCNFIKETPTEVFSSENCGIFKNTYFEEQKVFWRLFMFMYLLCICKKTIILSLFTIDNLNFTMYISTLWKCLLKAYVIRLRNLISMNIFFTMKDHNFTL